MIRFNLFKSNSTQLLVIITDLDIMHLFVALIQIKFCLTKILPVRTVSLETALDSQKKELNRCYRSTRQETTHSKVMLHRMKTYLIYLNSTHYRLSGDIKHDAPNQLFYLE